jgi:hypothetical protein
MIWALAVLAVVLSGAALFIAVLVFDALQQFRNDLGHLNSLTHGAHMAQMRRIEEAQKALENRLSTLSSHMFSIFPPPTKAQREAKDWAEFCAWADSQPRSGTAAVNEGGATTTKPDRTGSSTG